jgi:hypothetical protein
MLGFIAVEVSAMDSGFDYLPLQQPGPGYGTDAGSGSANYLARQSPASAYAAPGGAGGGGAASVPKATTYLLPDPETAIWSKDKGRVPHVSSLPLYLPKGPTYSEIRQQNIGNCYVAATLAALANTKSGHKLIRTMIAPSKGPITTVCYAWDSDNNKLPQRLELRSDRQFKVRFKSASVVVSDVLYHDDSDRDPNLMYLTTPGGDKALWGAVVEVAYAKLKGGYDNIGGSKVTVNQFLDEFSAVKWTALVPTKDEDAIKKACNNAGSKATFLATKESGKTTTLSPFHGYAVLGVSAAKVRLWDPMAGAVQVTFTELLPDVVAVFSS